MLQLSNNVVNRPMVKCAVSQLHHVRLDPEILAGKLTEVGATPHPNLWDLSGPILLLGAWCEPALEQLSRITYAVLPNRWDNRLLVEEAEAYCWKFFTYIVPQLASCLNKLHGTHWPEIYWKVLLGPWLLDAVHALYDRYLLACDVRRLASGASLTVPVSPTLPPITTLRGLSQFCTDEGNLSIFALVFKTLGLRVRERETPDPNSEKASIWRRSLCSLSLLSNQLALKVCSFRGGMRILVSVHHMKLTDYLYMAAHVRGLRVPAQSALSGEMPFSIDPARRKVLQEMTSRDEFEQMFISLLPELVPATMIENYDKVRRLSHSIFGDRVTPAVFTYFQEPLLEFAARASCSGLPVSMYQHGGGYGQYRTYPMERYHISEGHTFLSWGHQGPFIKPMPSPHLSRLRDSYRGGRSIVLIEVCMPKYVHRIHSKPQGHDGRLDAHMAAFIDGLPPRLSARLIFKQVPNRYESIRHPTLETLARENSNSSVSAYKLMRTVRLAVVTYPETTFIEALTLNVPTIGLWDFSLYEMRQEAQPYFDALAKSGIIYSDPMKAAQKVTDIYDQATDWWNSKEIQYARLAFLERFGLASRDWKRQWVVYLKELAASARL